MIIEQTRTVRPLAYIASVLDAWKQRRFNSSTDSEARGYFADIAVDSPGHEPGVDACVDNRRRLLAHVNVGVRQCFDDVRMEEDRVDRGLQVPFAKFSYNESVSSVPISMMQSFRRFTPSALWLTP